MSPTIASQVLHLTSLDPKLMVANYELRFHTHGKALSSHSIHSNRSNHGDAAFGEKDKLDNHQEQKLR